MASRLEKGLSIETSTANSVTATINVPLISSAKTTSLTNSNNDTDVNSKKTDRQSPPIPTPRSLFDIDNASSLKLADKLQQEARKYDVNAIDESSATATTTTTNEPLSYLNEPLPPSPIHHTIFGERRPSWRLKNDYNNKVNCQD